MDINNWKPVLGDICDVNGHKLEITKIINHPSGKIYKLSCYNTGCCTIPNILKIQCNIEDLKIFRNNLIKRINENG